MLPRCAPQVRVMWRCGGPMTGLGACCPISPPAACGRPRLQSARRRALVVGRCTPRVMAAGCRPPIAARTAGRGALPRLGGAAGRHGRWMISDAGPREESPRTSPEAGRSPAVTCSVDPATMRLREQARYSGGGAGRRALSGLGAAAGGHGRRLIGDTRGSRGGTPVAFERRNKESAWRKRFGLRS